MSVAVVRKPARHLRLPFAAAAEELRDYAEMTPTLVLVRLHWKSLLFPDIYYDQCGAHFTPMRNTGKGYNVGHPQKFLKALLQNTVTSGKDPSPKAKLPLAYLDLPATSPLIDFCTRKYRDWMEGCPAPKGDERATLEEHFVRLSKDFTPYDNDPGSPFVPLDFTLGLPPVKDWPRQVGEPPWVLDLKKHPKSSRNVLVDSTSSMYEGKKKKKKKKKHRHSKKTGNPELKVTTRGEGADTLVWTHAGFSKDSSSTSDSQSEGDSGLGSNPSIRPHQDTDTEPRQGATPRLSPDHTQQPTNDDPLSDRGKGDGDQEMPNAHEQQGEQQGVNDPTDPGPTPSETQEGMLPGDDQVETGDGEEPEEPEEPQEPYQIILQVFRTVSQTLSAAYGAASSEIQTVIWKGLAKATAEDQTFVWGASRAIHCWLDSVKPAMAATEESTKYQAQLLVEARQAGKDALDTILEFIPKEQEQESHLTSVFPRATPLLAAALVVARWHTDEALWNIHAQLVDLAKEHVPPEQVGALFNTILQVTCSFQQEMDNMATNQVFLPNQIVPNLWSSRRGLLEGLSLLSPPSCSASWPASLVEWVTAIPACQDISGPSKTPTKPSHPLSRVAKTTPDSRKKHSAKQATRLFWGDDARQKEDVEACQLEDKCRKKSTGPVLSLGDHEDSIANLLKWAPASQISQPSSKASSSGSKHWEKIGEKHPPTDPSDDEPLSDRADEPKAKSRKHEATPDLVILEDDDSTPLPGKTKGVGKKGHTQTPDEEEALEALCQHLKGEAWSIQYNLELSILTDYRNLHILNLKGPPNTDDHLAYLSSVRDVSWSYPAKGNLITTRQYYQDLKASKDPEAIEVGNIVLRDKGMMGILQESSKAGPIKCRYVIYILCSVEGQIIDARNSDYGRDWNIGLYDIVSLASMRKVEKSGSLIYKGRVVQGKVTHGYCPFYSYASTNHCTLNNHIWMHMSLTLACGMKDCWFVTHNSDLMWKHAAYHGLNTSEPIAVNKKKWIRVDTRISHLITGSYLITG